MIAKRCSRLEQRRLTFFLPSRRGLTAILFSFNMATPLRRLRRHGSATFLPLGFMATLAAPGWMKPRRSALAGVARGQRRIWRGRRCGRTSAFFGCRAFTVPAAMFWTGAGSEEERPGGEEVGRAGGTGGG